MVQLIPVIIRQLQRGRIPVNVQATLRKVFGTLWKLIVDEALRRRHKNAAKDMKSAFPTPMNPVLRSIIRAQRDYRPITNDIYHNTVAQLQRKANAAIALKLNEQWKQPSELPQRILKVAAMLIQQSLQHENAGQQQKPSTVNIEEVQEAEPFGAILHLAFPGNIDGAKMRHKRVRRNVLHDLSDINEEQRNALQALIGNDNDENYDEDDLPIENGIAVSGDDGDAISRQSKADYADYAFDVTAVGDDGDEMLRQMYGAPDYNDYDGSISELFNLAASHNLRKQRNSDYLKANNEMFKEFVNKGELNVGNEY